MATGLILVDVQNEYFPGGRLELAGVARAAGNARDVLALFRDRGWPTFHVQHLSARNDAPLFSPGRPSVELHQSGRPPRGERVRQERSPNSAHQTPLPRELKVRGVDRSVIVGALR